MAICVYMYELLCFSGNSHLHSNNVSQELVYANLWYFGVDNASLITFLSPFFQA